MALPSSYTESSLRDYMLFCVSALADTLGLAASDFSEAVNDALVAYGVTDIALATNIAKLRGIAKAEAWRLIVTTTVGEYNFSADGGSYSREQLHKHAVDALARAEADAISRGYMDSGAPMITMGSMKHTDPYLTNETLFA
jgi:hypothetical protein